MARNASEVDNNLPYGSIHALIIGINDYPKLKHLAGAVADADDVAGFLLGLGVPPGQITNLRNQQATRHAIITAFRELTENPGICVNDPILIFYAGHGGLADAPESWKQSGYDKIQVIFPYDYNTKPWFMSEVECIPDRTIQALLNNLAAAKGDNITVIFDSCHSASGSREDDIVNPGSNRIARDPGIKVTISPHIDQKLLASASLHIPEAQEMSSISRGFKRPFRIDQASHVHISACGSEEISWEDDGHGLFTKALLEKLREIKLEDLSYRDLAVIDLLLAVKSTVLWDSHVSGHLHFQDISYGGWSFRVQPEGKDKLILSVGALAGVTLGSIWELYMSSDDGFCPAGRFKACKPECMHTELHAVSQSDHTKAAMDLYSSKPGTLYARRISAGDVARLRVHFSPEAHDLIYSRHISAMEEEASFWWTKVEALADADIMAEVQTSRSPQLSGAAPHQQVKLTLRDAESVEGVLEAAARWNWHLRRDSLRKEESDVDVEFLSVTRSIDSTKSTAVGKNLINNGLVEIPMQKEDCYGVRIVNRGSTAFYIRCFYFNADDFSICDLTPPCVSNSRVDPELSARGTFMIGDGSNGGQELRFELQPSQDLELGFIRVFWSSEPLEMNDVEQDSAFKGGARAPVLCYSDNSPKWGATFFTLVQRR
ncbi:ICE-like protease (caspase) p20 domain protein [Ceratobasidium sp. AG-Ba]|nr:ICE-like protease (caspase) p20 domain protein [Ceratobasidium sp. AG-Ba]